MIGTILRDKNGIPTAPLSDYIPPEGVRDLTLQVKEAYQVGYNLQRKPFREFNDRSLLAEIEYGQKIFNAYVDARSQDPDESWRANVVRPLARNKIISIAAHITSTILYPSAVAQNEDDEEDVDAAQVMRDLMEWNIRNSDYEEAFLFAVVSALVNPVTYVEHRFVRGMMKRRGKEVLDPEISGFQTLVVPADEMLISNAYEYEIQRQRFLIRRRWIDYDEAKSLWGRHENFGHVAPGIKMVFDDTTNAFYRLTDEEHPTVVEEITYLNRREDKEIPFVNGVYVGSSDLENSMRHRDTFDNAHYPYAKTGYEPIDEKRFFFYRSAAVKLAPEQDLLNTMYRMVHDGTFLSVMQPLLVSGDSVDSSVMVPGGVTPLEKDATVTPVRIGDLSTAWNAIERIEDSMSESAISDIKSGIPEGPQKTAFEIRRLEQNAQIRLGLFGKMIGALVVSSGKLMSHLIIRHQTVGEAMEVAGQSTRLKFQSFFLSGEKKRIRFTDRHFGKEFTPESMMEESDRLMEESGGFDSDMSIWEVDPRRFAKLHFSFFFEPDQLVPKSEAVERALKLEAYQLGKADLNINQEQWTKDFLIEVFAKGKSDKYLKKSQELLGMGNLPPVSPPGGTAKGANTSLSKNTVQREVLSQLPT